MAAFEVDLPGYRFGWRQVASVSAAAAVVLGTLPIIAAVPNGRWRAPSEGFDRVLGFLGEDAGAGDFRVLWVGDPDVLPGGSWELGDGTAFTVSDGGLPTVENRWPGSSDGATELVADALGIARRREASRVGRLLAPMGIRYVVLPGAVAPRGGPARPISRDLATALGEQLDLVARAVDPRLLVFENQAWVPVRAQAAAGTVPVGGDGDYFSIASSTDLAGAAPVLPGQPSPAHWTGEVAPGDVYAAVASSPRWELRVGGEAVDRAEAFGWSNAFTVTEGGVASLEFRTSPARWFLLALQGVLWALVIAVLVSYRRPRRQRPAEPVDAAEPTDAAEPVLFAAVVGDGE